VKRYPKNQFGSLDPKLAKACQKVTELAGFDSIIHIDSCVDKSR
jgi:hypothetical protein